MHSAGYNKYIYHIARTYNETETKSSCKVLVRKFPAIRSQLFLLRGANIFFLGSVIFHVRKGTKSRYPGSVARK